MFTGDIMGHDGQIASAYDDSTGTYSYDSVFRYISPLLSAADIAIGNLEVTLGGAPYKGYPAFSSPDALAEACRDAGFDILTTANNHAADRGPKGITRTIRVLDSLEIRHTGTWINSEARDSLSPLMISVKVSACIARLYLRHQRHSGAASCRRLLYRHNPSGNDIKNSAEMRR